MYSIYQPFFYQSVEYFQTLKTLLFQFTTPTVDYFYAFGVAYSLWNKVNATLNIY